MFRRRQRGPSQGDSGSDPLAKLVESIARKPHWVMYTAFFGTVDEAVKTLDRLSFVDEQRFIGDVEGAVAEGPDETMVVLGGTLMAEQMAEVGFHFSTEARRFDMRWKRGDEVTEGRLRRSAEADLAPGDDGGRGIAS